MLEDVFSIHDDKETESSMEFARYKPILST